MEPVRPLHLLDFLRGEQLRKNGHGAHEGDPLLRKDDGLLTVQHSDEPLHAPLQRGRPVRFKPSCHRIAVNRRLAVRMVGLFMNKELLQLSDSFRHKTLHSNP